jgi:hypothetical protein
VKSWPILCRVGLAALVGRDLTNSCRTGTDEAIIVQDRATVASHCSIDLRDPMRSQAGRLAGWLAGGEFTTLEAGKHEGKRESTVGMSHPVILRSHARARTQAHTYTCVCPSPHPTRSCFRHSTFPSRSILPCFVKKLCLTARDVGSVHKQLKWSVTWFCDITLTLMANEI